MFRKRVLMDLYLYTSTHFVNHWPTGRLEEPHSIASPTTNPSSFPYLSLVRLTPLSLWIIIKDDFLALLQTIKLTLSIWGAIFICSLIRPFITKIRMPDNVLLDDDDDVDQVWRRFILKKFVRGFFVRDSLPQLFLNISHLLSPLPRHLSSWLVGNEKSDAATERLIIVVIE